MNLNLIKLLPVIIGIGAVSSGTIGGVANNAHHPSTLQTSDPFVTWAVAAQKDAQTNLVAILKVAPVADWKMNDHISIISVKVDIWNESVDIVLQDGSWGMRATVSDIWVEQNYNINQWWCSIEPRDTNAHLNFENWYTGWNSFSKLDPKTQVTILVGYWSDHQLKGAKTNNTFIKRTTSGGVVTSWNANISNIVLHGKTITATYHFFPLAVDYYNSINVTFTWNGAVVFNDKVIQPIGDWSRVSA